MRVVMFALLGGLIITLSSLPVWAWKLSLQQLNETDPKVEVVVSNDREQNDVEAYLVLFDMDAEEKGDQFVSWTFDEGWQRGLKSASSSPMDLAPFEPFSLTLLDESCPESHRCFLALVTLPPGEEPLADEFWLAASVLPLSLSASRERLPGQQFFLPTDGNVERDEVMILDNPMALSMPTMDSAPAEAPVKQAEESSGTVETEKPDIFKWVDNKVLYANGDAKRFQIIDVADLREPKLTGWTALAGNPRELYTLGDYHVLLQTDYDAGEGETTHLTVLSQDEVGNPTTTQDEEGNPTTVQGLAMIVQELTLPGQFVESRRRDEFIYTVTQDFTFASDIVDCVYCGGERHLNLNVFKLSQTGQLELVDEAQLPGYSPTVAIFSDYLIIANHNPEEKSWRTTQIQMFDLSQAGDPLVALPTLKVPGQVPSEFHLSVVGEHLRVVYGPEDRKDGSTLGIYDLQSPKMALIGEVDQIAPGEDLFATRFIEDRAFVVTYERQDPLWVIDLSNPTAPKILGELHVPGWSEKMFFHEDRLFAVGIDDQPLENEASRWVRRVALSLFDVADPTKPSLINRFTPLAGEVSNSWSPALDDERALLLNWTDAFAAVPITSWESETGNYLQMVSLANDRIDDAGRLDTLVPIQRSLSIAPDVLVALSDQALLTLRWGGGKPQVLGELELATNLSWLHWQGDKLWAAATGNKGYYRFYRYNPPEVETVAQRWDLPRGYAGLTMNGNSAVFYDYNPLAVQVLDLGTGRLNKAQVLEANEAPSKLPVEPLVETMIAPPTWYDRSQPLMHDGWFYIAEQRAFESVPEQAMLLPPKPDYWQPQWILRSWNLKVEEAKEASTRSIPGRPLAFTVNGELITQENTEKGQIRLNLLALSAGSANLLKSRELPCQAYSQVFWTDETLYVNCSTENRYYWSGPAFVDTAVVSTAMVREEGSSEKREEEPADPGKPAPVAQEEPTTQLLKLNPSNGFAEEGKWTLAGSWDLRAAAGEVVLVASNGWYGPGVIEDAVISKPAASEATILPVDYQSGCNIYQLTSKPEPVLLKHLDNCPYNNDGVVLTPNRAWLAEGFAGIKEISW